MIIETMIIIVSMLIIGMLISRACKNSKEPTINNHYGDVNNYTNSNNITNSQNTTTDSRTDNRHHIKNELSEKDEILKEIAKLIGDVEKEREISALLKANEDLINKYKK